MRSAAKQIDQIQTRIADYALTLGYVTLPPEAIHAAKVRIIDTLGALIGGFEGEPCRIARSLALQMSCSSGATILGSREQTTPDMAAFVNGTTARYLEMTDTYHWPGSFDGHPSDVISPLMAVAETEHANGRELIKAVILSYEIYIRFCDVFDNPGFDHTNFCSLAVTVGSGSLMHLDRSRLQHALSMAVVSGNVLRQTRLGNLSMFKGAASGQAGRLGVFAAQLARAGLEGPAMPFQGVAGWCNHVARKAFSLEALGEKCQDFKILDTSIKQRPSSGPTIPVVFAAEKLAGKLRSLNEVESVVVELYRKAIDWAGDGAHHWDPRSRETADHSAPYVVAATLMDGTLTTHSYDANRLWNPDLRTLMAKVKVVEDEEFTRAYERLPVEHHARVTVTMRDGDRLVGKSGGDENDLSGHTSDAEIATKFAGLTEEFIGKQRIQSILDLLWSLDEVDDIALIPSLLVIE